MFGSKYLPFFDSKVLGLSLLTLILSIIPFPFFGTLFIPWFWAFLYLWQSDNNYDFTPVFIFMLALIFDFFSGGIVGLSPLLFLIFSRLVFNKRFILRGQTFVIKWLLFIGLTAFLFLIQYLLVSLFALKFVDVSDFVLVFIFLSLLYPLFYKIYQWVNDAT